MIKEISKKEFKERFPETDTYNSSTLTEIFLDNGIMLLSDEWNGEVYTDTITGKQFRPMQKPISFDDNGEPEDWETIGYEEV